MDMEKFTDRARGFLQAAQTIAIREGHPRIGSAHLLKALLDDEQGLAAGLIQRAGGDPAVARRAVERMLAGLPKVSGAAQVGFDTEALRVLDAAQQAAAKAGDAFVTVQRLLLGCAIVKDSEAGRALAEARVTAPALEEAISGRHARPNGAKRLGRGHVRRAGQIRSRPYGHGARGQARPRDRAR